MGEGEPPPKKPPCAEALFSKYRLLLLDLEPGTGTWNWNLPGTPKAQRSCTGARRRLEIERGPRRRWARRGSCRAAPAERWSAPAPFFSSFFFPCSKVGIASTTAWLNRDVSRPHYRIFHIRLPPPPSAARPGRLRVRFRPFFFPSSTDRSLRLSRSSRPGTLLNSKLHVFLPLIRPLSLPHRPPRETQHALPASPTSATPAPVPIWRRHGCTGLVGSSCAA